MHGIAAIALLSMVSVFPSVSFAQACAIGVKPASNDLEYQQRGDRCEGEFGDLVAGGRIDIRVVGYHYNPVNMGSAGDRQLELRVLGETPSVPVVLKVVSLRWEDYYQMDTGNVKSGGAFVWPLSIVRKKKPEIRSDHLAGVACAPDCNRSLVNQVTLFPVVFPGAAANSAAPQPRLIVMADEALAEMRVRFSNDAGAVKEFVVASQLPQHEAVPVFIPDMPGQYLRVSFFGETGRGQKDQIEMRLFVPRAAH